jgi:hypothetical protein
LDSIEISNGYFQIQEFVNGVGANASGPKKIVLHQCDVGENEADNFSVLIKPLLDNSRLKVLQRYSPRNGCNASLYDLNVIKASFQSNQSLEELHNCDDIENFHALELFLQAIASAPKLRTLRLENHNDGSDSEVEHMSPQKVSEMFASALKECKNSSLEVFLGTFTVTHKLLCDETVWNREVVPIFEFNRERHLFREHSNSFLVLADRTDNHHLRFWLVRQYAGGLRRKERKPRDEQKLKTTLVAAHSFMSIIVFNVLTIHIGTRLDAKRLHGIDCQNSDRFASPICSTLFLCHWRFVS